MKQNILKFIKNFIFYFIVLWLITSLTLGFIYSIKCYYINDIFILTISTSLICTIIKWFLDKNNI
jgi:hypothetical protein